MAQFMKLTEEEKKEMLEDARSPSRRAAFAEARRITDEYSRRLSHEEYFEWLKTISEILPVNRTEPSRRY